MAKNPILFNEGMVRAILAGRKTQTRRAVKNIPLCEPYFEIEDGEPFACDINGDWYPAVRFSQIQPGDVLWVREPWARTADGYRYRADCADDTDGVTWKSSIYIPRDAVRLFLHVRQVRMERLQDITPDDVVAEGVVASTEPLRLLEFKAKWDGTIAKSEKYRYGWEANPWVYAIEFERIKTPPKRMV